MSAEQCWIEVHSGNRFMLLDPTPEQIRIEDIAHALANQCRFTGHARRFISVAEHSYWVSQICAPEDALWGLLHDASEAYLSDLSRPLKHLTAVGPPYLEIEARIMAAVCQHFGIPETMPASVHEADRAMLLCEKNQLLSRLPWSNAAECDAIGAAADIKLECWLPAEAEGKFLARFYELTERR